jgi:ribosomal protein L32
MGRVRGDELEHVVIDTNICPNCGGYSVDDGVCFECGYNPVSDDGEFQTWSWNK